MNLNEQIKDLDLIDPPSKITELQASIEWHRDKHPICLEEWLTPDQLEIFSANIVEKLLYKSWEEKLKYDLEHLAKTVFNLNLNQTIFTGPFTVKVYNDINNKGAMNLKFIVLPLEDIIKWDFDEDE
jgi:hypothetical protein